MSSAQQNFNTNQAQAKTEANFQAAKDSASKAVDRAQAAYNTTGQAREENKEEATGLLQQTGEQVKNMAQGAMDTVKHTLGMDKN